MAAELSWDDAEDFGIALTDKFPEQDPLEVRFTDLHRYVPNCPSSSTTQKRRANASWKRSKWRGTRSGRTGRNSRVAR